MKLRPRPFTSLMVMVAAALVALAIPANGAANAACSTNAGTTVVVDFGALGGQVDVGCATGSPGSGFEALAQAGFDVTRVQSNPGFLCRIDGLPAADSEACQAIPPASAHWSYWTANSGGSWQLSRSGAAAAVAGDFEGWTFSTGQPVAPRYSLPTTTTSTTITSTTTTSLATPTTTTPPTQPNDSPTPAPSASSTTATTTTTPPEDPPDSTIPPLDISPSDSSRDDNLTGAQAEPTIDPPADAPAKSEARSEANPEVSPEVSPGANPEADTANERAGTALAVIVIAVGGLGAGFLSRRRRQEADS